METIGKSVEGRDIYAVEIKKNKQDVQKVLVEGGIHGHEWISAAFVTYLINEILRAEANGDSRLILLSRKYHWLFVPMLNPDGYSFNQREVSKVHQNFLVFSIRWKICRHMEINLNHQNVFTKFYNRYRNKNF